MSLLKHEPFLNSPKHIYIKTVINELSILYVYKYVCIDINNNWIKNKRPSIWGMWGAEEELEETEEGEADVNTVPIYKSSKN